MLVRAAVALVFGAVTVFWASPSQAGMGWAGGAYLLATGVVLLWSVSRTGLRTASAPSKMLAAAGAVLTGTGAAVALMPSDLVFGVLTALGVGLAGAAELFLGITHRAGRRGRHGLGLAVQRLAGFCRGARGAHELHRDRLL